MQGSDDLLKSLLEGGILELEPGSAQSYVREDLIRAHKVAAVCPQ